MKQKEMLEIVLSELKIFYNSSPGKKSIKKLQEPFRKFKTLNFNQGDIIDYIDFCYKRMKKTVRQLEKRAGVDYFVGIIASEKTLNQYLDLLIAKGERKQETTSELNISDECDDEIILDGLKYIKIMSSLDRDIFLCYSALKFLVRDYSDLVPRLYSISTYNLNNPDRKITWDTVKNVIKEDELCPM